jgi:hypothetical protein
MLVSFHKGFIMEGENTITERKHFWSKPESKRHKIYCTTGVSGICDESEVEQSIEVLTNLRLKSEGWGKEFSGWQRVLSYEESVEIGKRDGWYKDYTDHYLPTTEVTLKYLDNWTVAKAAKELNGKQFAQYCRDYGIVIKGVGADE